MKEFISRWRRKIKSFLCTVVNGGHELYRARREDRLYQECLLCGHETHGWHIERRDRRVAVPPPLPHDYADRRALLALQPAQRVIRFRVPQWMRNLRDVFTEREAA